MTVDKQPVLKGVDIHMNLLAQQLAVASCFQSGGDDSKTNELQWMRLCQLVVVQPSTILTES